MTAEELLFFEPKPQLLPLYLALREKLDQAYPQLEVKVGKTQISFRNRHVFAMVSLPWRRVKGWPEDYLLLSFGLSYRKDSPRIVQAVEPWPNRWTHHVLLQREEELDPELLGWMDEAFQFALLK